MFSRSEFSNLKTLIIQNKCDVTNAPNNIVETNASTRSKIIFHFFFFSPLSPFSFYCPSSRSKIIFTITSLELPNVLYTLCDASRVSVQLIAAAMPCGFKLTSPWGKVYLKEISQTVNRHKRRARFEMFLSWGIFVLGIREAVMREWGIVMRL